LEVKQLQPGGDIQLPVTVNYRSDKPIQVPFHSHSHYEIYYFQGGTCNYLIGDKIYVLQPGDLIIMHGLTLHCANVDPRAEYIRSVIHFDPSYVQGLFQFPRKINILQPFQELGNQRIHLLSGQQNELEQLWKRLFAHFCRRDDAVHYTRFNIVLMDLLVLVYGFYQKMMKARAESSASLEKVNHVQSIISFIEGHYQQDIHLEHFEDHLHLNKYYLAKLFKEVTGVTIFDYLLQRRINEAKILFLMDKQLGVTEVSYKVGFKHPSHFSRVFKSKVGYTPEQFRKQQDANQS
jgi:AraC-like DNA-binding protein